MLTKLEYWAKQCPNKKDYRSRSDKLDLSRAMASGFNKGSDNKRQCTIYHQS